MCFLRGVGSNFAAVRVFRRRSARGCFVSSLMDSKGNVRHFFGVLFAWRGLESCCCSSVSEALRQRLSKLETLALVAVPPEAALYLL